MKNKAEIEKQIYTYLEFNQGENLHWYGNFLWFCAELLVKDGKKSSKNITEQTAAVRRFLKKMVDKKMLLCDRIGTGEFGGNTLGVKSMNIYNYNESYKF